MVLVVEAHPRTEVLAEACAGAVRTLRGGGPLAPVWIVSPTQRLGRELQAHLAAALGGAALGVERMDLKALARRLSRRLPVEARPALLPVAARVLAGRALEDEGESRLLEFRGAAASLLPGFAALREAGVDPAAALAAGTGGAGGPPLVLRTYARWAARLETAAVDDGSALPDRVAAALKSGAGAPALPPIVLFGFSALVGRWRRLVTALAACTDLHLFAHARGTEAGAGEAPADGFESSEALLAELLAGAGSGRGPLRRLPGPPSAPPARVGHAAVRGPAGELEEALRAARRWHAEGIPLEEIGIVARSIDTYAPHVRPLAAMLAMEHALDVAGQMPLARHPAAAALRRALARSGAPAASQRHVDRELERALAAAAGDETLHEALQEADCDVRQAQQLGAREDPAALLEEALESSTLPLASPQGGGGLQILDAQQVRGLHFRKLVLLGFHQGGWPRPVREDAWLDDARRARLQKAGAARTPLPTLEDQRRDEHLLLQLALRSAHEELLVLRQHADASGSAVAESPALPDLEQFLGASLPPADLLSSDPLARAARHVREGLAAPGEAATALAETGPGAEAARALAASAPAVAARLGPAPAWIEVVDSWEPEDCSFDGVLPPGSAAAALTSPLAPTRLEQYGRSPLSFFFERILRVPPREARRLPGPPPDALGIAVHDALERAWRAAVTGDGTLQTLTGAAERAASALLDPLFAAARGAHPGAERWLLLERERWQTALRRFLEWDHGRLAGGSTDQRLKHPPLQIAEKELEMQVEGALQLDGGAVAFSGQVDRIARGGGEARIADYKTGRSADAGDLNKLLRGERLQLGLYLLLAEAAGLGATSAEALRVHPDCDYTQTAAAGGFGSAVSAARWAVARHGVLETASVALQHLRAGHFPATRTPEKRSDHRAPWDGWFATQRLGHEPSLGRIAAFDGWRDLLDLEQKHYGRKSDGSQGVFTLKEVRAQAAPAEAGA